MPLHAVPNLHFNGYFSQGDWEGWCNVKYDLPIEKDNVFYRVETHSIGDDPGTWVITSDVPWGSFYLGVPVKFATATPGGGPRIRIVDQIKVTTTSTDDSQTPVSVIINTPTSLVSNASTHFSATNFRVQTGGLLGSLNGFVNIFWDDLTKFVQSGRILLQKFGVTSPLVKQTLIDRSWSSKPSRVPSFVQLSLKLIPPGIYLTKDDTGDIIWDQDDPPTPDPNAPKWVVEGDRLTFSLTTDNGFGPITTVKNFYYYHTTSFYQFSDAAVAGQPYSKQLQTIQDQYIPIPIVATYEGGASMPPGLSVSSSGLISGTPTAIQDIPYAVRIWVANLTGWARSEEIFIAVNEVGQPIIKSPGHNINWTANVPWSHAYDLYATNYPTSYNQVSGVMPTGLSLDSATGNINGTPRQEQTTIVRFTATNATGDSPEYAITFNILVFEAPEIISATTLDCYLEEFVRYKILTDLLAQAWRMFDPPEGLKLTGKLIHGKPTAKPGNYIVGLQANNRWGWGPVFQLTVTVAVAPPEIYSALKVYTEVDSDFTYQIQATHSPRSFEAQFLLDGLILNGQTGWITGSPLNPTKGASSFTNVGQDVLISAINEGGSDDKILNIEVNLPSKPVIDMSIAHGKAFTAETGKDIGFGFIASHNPTTWTASPVPEGMTLLIIPDEPTLDNPHPKGTSALLKGKFLSGGFFQVGFTAKNKGGISDMATFSFLVSISEEIAQEINLLGTIMEIWVDLNTAAVGIGNTATVEDEVIVVPHGSTLTVKRGDTTDLRIIFHEDGIPADVHMTSLKFGMKPSFDDEFIIYTDSFSVLGAGRFGITPDFSGSNDDLDAILVGASTTLPAEIQWEMITRNGISVRRSSHIFSVAILRDLIHPD